MVNVSFDIRFPPDCGFVVVSSRGRERRMVFAASKRVPNAIALSQGNWGAINKTELFFIVAAMKERFPNRSIRLNDDVVLLP